MGSSGAWSSQRTIAVTLHNCRTGHKTGSGNTSTARGLAPCDALSLQELVLWRPARRFIGDAPFKPLLGIDAPLETLARLAVARHALA